MKSRFLFIFLCASMPLVGQSVWPVELQYSQHSVAGTVGEYRSTTRFHKGVDITNGTDYNVYATVAGQAMVRSNGFSSYIQIGNTRYVHVNFQVQDGEVVNVGDLIGTMITQVEQGQAVHVHYEGDNINFLNGYLNPFWDYTNPIIGTTTLYVDGVRRTNNSVALNTVVNLQNRNYKLVYNKIDIVSNIRDTRLNDGGHDPGVGGTAPYQVSFELYDNLNTQIGEEQAYIRFNTPGVNNFGGNDILGSVFASGTTRSTYNWIVTSSPHTAPYDRYLNTKLRQGVTENWLREANRDGRYNGESFYGDGLYELRINARDVDGNADFNEASQSNYILIDNFRPYIKEVIVNRQGAFETRPVYKGTWSWNGSALELLQENHDDAGPTDEIWIKIVTSEPMQSLSINIPSVDGPIYHNLTSVPGSNDMEFLWTNEPIATSGPNPINLAGADFAGNPLQTNPAQIPVRQTNGSWTATSAGVDQHHHFNTGTSQCVPSGGRISKPLTACLVADFQSDIRMQLVNQPVLFTNLSFGATGSVQYQWNFGSGAVPSTAMGEGPHTIYYASEGIKTVTLTATDTEGSTTETKSGYITVINDVEIADFNVYPTTGLAPLSVSFTGPSQGVSSWYWSFPGGTPSYSTQQNPSTFYNSAGIFDVSLTINGTETISKSGLISVASTPTMSAIISSCDNYYFTGCSTLYKENQLVYFEADIIGGNPFYEYLWNFGDGTTSTVANPGHIFQSGSYTVSLTVHDQSGLVASASIPVSIETIIPFINVDFTASDTYVESTDGPVIFTDATVSNLDLTNATYFWNFGEGAYPRYAYTKGPHSVCYDALEPNKNVYLRVVETTTNTIDDEYKFNHLYIAGKNLSNCEAYFPQWTSTPGGAFDGISQNCLWPDDVSGMNHGDFQDFQCTYTSNQQPTYDCAFSVNDPCFPDSWYASHGDVGIENYGIPGGSLQSPALRMWAAGRIYTPTNQPVLSGEGLYYQFNENLDPKKLYRLSFWAKTKNYLSGLLTLHHLRVALTSGLMPNTNCGATNEDFALPNYSFLNHDLGSFDYAINATWHCFEVIFSPPTSDFNQIWLYPRFEPSLLSPTGTTSQCWFFIDNFSLRTYCTPHLTITNTFALNETHHAENTLVTSGPLVIDEGMSGNFKAGNSVTLKPGFVSKTGSNFKAAIESCNTEILPGGRIESVTQTVQPTNRYYVSRIDDQTIWDKEPKYNDEEVGMTISPNPTSGEFTIEVDLSGIEGEAFLSIVSLDGVEIYSKGFQETMTIKETVDISEHSSGLYLVRVVKGGKTIFRKLIKL